MPRACELCFYGESYRLEGGGTGNSERDCVLTNNPDSPNPKELFGLPQDQVRPTKLDGKEIGHYCPGFAPFDID